MHVPFTNIAIAKNASTLCEMLTISVIHYTRVFIYSFAIYGMHVARFNWQYLCTTVAVQLGH